MDINLHQRVIKIVATLFWAGICGAFYYYKVSHEYTYLDTLFVFIDFLTMSMYGPFVYVAIYTVRPLVFFPASLLTVFSGALFGPMWGIVYTMIGENLSASVAYLVGRYFAAPLRMRTHSFDHFMTALRTRTFATVLAMRLLYVPFDLVNYGAGILKVPWLPYSIATLIGIMPGLVVFVLLGASIDVHEIKMSGLTAAAIDGRLLIFSVTIFVVSLFVSKIFRQR